MKVLKIQPQNYGFKSESPSKKEKFTDKFSSKIKNSADLNDCVAVPRSVFKGYLAFMLGTTIAYVANYIPNKKIKNSMQIAGNLINTWGVWSFVRPYVIKDATPTVKGSADLNA